MALFAILVGGLTERYCMAILNCVFLVTGAVYITLFCKVGITLQFQRLVAIGFLIKLKLTW